MSSETENGKQSPLQKIFPLSHTASPQEEVIAQLQEENARLKDAIHEERFCWVVVSIILFDCAIFMRAETWAAPLSILALQLLLIIVIARKLGVQQIILFIDRVIDSYARSKKD
jgi:hypothetical protein